MQISNNRLFKHTLKLQKSSFFLTGRKPFPFLALTPFCASRIYVGPLHPHSANGGWPPYILLAVDGMWENEGDSGGYRAEEERAKGGRYCKCGHPYIWLLTLFQAYRWEGKTNVSSIRAFLPVRMGRAGFCRREAA